MNSQGPDLPKFLFNYLESKKQELKANYSVEAIILTGSYARGDFNKYSDVDIYCFTKNQVEPEYQLEYYDQSILISTSFSTIEFWNEQLLDVEYFYFLRPAIIQAHILFDPEDKFQQLKSKADDLSINLFDTRAKKKINSQAVGYIEEVHKLMDAVADPDPVSIQFALLGVNHAVIELMKYYLSFEAISENEVYHKILERVSKAGYPQWAEYWRAMWALTFSDLPPIKRGEMGLRLFYKTIQIIRPILDQNSISMLEVTLRKITDLL